MIKKQKYVTATVVCITTFLLLLSVIFADAETSKITVYNKDGSIKKVMTFGYVPITKPYQRPTKVITNRSIKKETNKKAPKAPTGAHIVEEHQNFEKGWKKKKYRDMTKKEKAVWRKMTKFRGRTRTITKAESHWENSRQVTTIYRNEKDKNGQRWKTKETMIDNRHRARTTQEQRKASATAPSPIRTFKEKRVP